MEKDEINDVLKPFMVVDGANVSNVPQPQLYVSSTGWNTGYKAAMEDMKSRLLPEGFSCIDVTDKGFITIRKPDDITCVIENKSGFQLGSIR